MQPQVQKIVGENVNRLEEEISEEEPLVFGRGYLPEHFRQIRTNLPELFWQIRTNLPELIQLVRAIFSPNKELKKNVCSLVQVFFK